VLLTLPKREHVDSDLRPYSCIVPDCHHFHNSTFASHEEWQKHEVEFGHHRRDHRYDTTGGWVCVDGCKRRFQNKWSFEQHVLKDHLRGDSSLKDGSIKDVVYSCEQEDPLALRIWHCEFCEDAVWGTSAGMRLHIGRHMVDIALKVLPQVEPEEYTNVVLKTLPQAEPEECTNHQKTAIVTAVDVIAPGNDPSRNAILQAARGGNNRLVRTLLDTGADVNSVDSFGTALQAAAENGNIELVKILLDAGASVNASPPSQGRTALQEAVQNNNTELVRILLDAGADVNSLPVPGKYYGGTVLTAATFNRNIELVRVLLDAGAEINAQVTKHEHTTLQAAAEIDNIELVRILLDYGADVNAPAPEYGRTPLEAAAQKGNTELVLMLLDAGADVNAPTVSHSTALGAAAQEGNIELVRILLGAGADINAQALNHSTALEAAAQEGNTEPVRILPDAGADVTTYGTALEAAVESGNIELVRILLGAGANVNAPALNHSTALGAAAKKGNIELVRILLDAGADVNAPATMYGTALEAAVESGNTELVRILLNAGADVNAPIVDPKWGRTALQAAIAEKCNIELVRLLLNAGADVDAPAAMYGKTALEAAVQTGSPKLTQLLQNSSKQVVAPADSSYSHSVYVEIAKPSIQKHSTKSRQQIPFQDEDPPPLDWPAHTVGTKAMADPMSIGSSSDPGKGSEDRESPVGVHTSQVCKYCMLQGRKCIKKLPCKHCCGQYQRFLEILASK